MNDKTEELYKLWDENLPSIIELLNYLLYKCPDFTADDFKEFTTKSRSDNNARKSRKDSRIS